MNPVLIILQDGFADWETPLISGGGKDWFGVEVRHAAPGGGSVTSMGGLRVDGLPDIDPAPGEVVVVCGGAAWERGRAADLTPVLRRAFDQGSTVAGICAGTTALAAAGLLDGVAHTSNSAGTLASVPGYAGTDRYRAQPAAVSDGRVITAPGTAPASFAAAVLAAAGVPADQVAQFSAMIGAEHRG